MNKRFKIVWVAVVAFVIIVCAVVCGLVFSERPPDEDECGPSGVVADADTAALKKEFENAWLPHVEGYTNCVWGGTADEYRDMMDFVKLWRPRLLKHQLEKESDPKVRERLADWLIRFDTIEGLYYAVLVPHKDLMSILATYEGVPGRSGMKDAKMKLGEVELQFKDGCAKWIDREEGEREMTAVIVCDSLKLLREGDVWAYVKTGRSEDFVGSRRGSEDCPQLSWWLVHFVDGLVEFSCKLPASIYDVSDFPSPKDCPYGRTCEITVSPGQILIMEGWTGSPFLAIDR